MLLGTPTGFRDFSTEEMILRKKVLEKIEKCLIKYGFDPIETPVIEYWETFKDKYGEEAETKLMYKFQDPWSKKWYALRFDLTVPMARFFSAQALPIPFKRYHIGRVWRHDRPQKGRYREFWQADADIVGSPYPEADAELLDLTVNVFETLGFKNFTIKLNDRRLLRGIFEEELKLDNVIEVYRIIDKKDKIGTEGVIEGLKKLGLSAEKIDKIIEIISAEYRSEKLLEKYVEKFSGNKNVSTSVSHLLEILDYLGSKRQYVRFSLDLVRGLDYYTGPVWEVILNEVKIGSIAGGGRYDELIKRYSGKDYPATGTSFGVERIIDAGKELGIFKTDVKTYTKIYVISLGENVYSSAWKIVRLLRDHGYSAQIDLMRRNEKKQREYASKKGIPILIYIGEKEVRTETVTIYDRQRNKRYEVKQSELLNIISQVLQDF